MPRWSFAVPLDTTGRIPLFRQIAAAVAKDVARGRLRPGDRLPCTRHLARSLRLNRNTVVAAYSELRAEGWITTSAASGTFVSRLAPSSRSRPLGKGHGTRAATELGYDLPSDPGLAEEAGDDSRPYPPGTLALLAGSPDVRLVPVEALARAYRSAIRAPGRRTLAYGDPRGHPRLRAGLAAMLSATRGLAAGSESVLVTRGSQMALTLVARALVRPGDAVAVEELGYRPGFAAFRLAGARLVPIPLDGEGLRVDALEARLAEAAPRAVYLTPHHQYPTTATLSPERRRRLLELARERRFAIVEDDYDHEFQYEGRPVLPMASADTTGVVIYVGTLSKILAPGLRIGYVVAPSSLVEQMALDRSFIDGQGDLALEAAVAELLEEGEILRHVRKARGLYEGRRDALVDALRSTLGGDVSFEVPRGGLAIWVRVLSGLDVERWARAGLDFGVAFDTARAFSIDGQPRPFARLGFGCLDEKELCEAVTRLARARPSLKRCG
jgi:GntR family transcriptional regulator / MocR family aminotransferase